MWLGVLRNSEPSRDDLLEAANEDMFNTSDTSPSQQQADVGNIFGLIRRAILTLLSRTRQCCLTIRERMPRVLVPLRLFAWLYGSQQVPRNRFCFQRCKQRGQPD